MFLNGFYIPMFENPIPASTISDDLCRVAIECDFQFLNSLYHAGCGYDNFRSAFRVIANKRFPQIKELNWSAFDDYWDEIFPHPDKAIIYFNWNGQFNHLGSHVKELSNLLYKLVNEKS